jgi:rRNA maturation RNase YbeY
VECFSLHNTTRQTPDTSLFLPAKKHILGNNYDLSVVLCGDVRIRALNVNYRNKTYTPNVLSFPIDTEHGEIFLNLAQIAREAHHYHNTSHEHLHYLLIHGMLHLKGHAHGSTMEKAECLAMHIIFPDYQCDTSHRSHTKRA